MIGAFRSPEPDLCETKPQAGGSHSEGQEHADLERLLHPEVGKTIETTIMQVRDEQHE
jgi:hypothetical protein